MKKITTAAVLAATALASLSAWSSTANSRVAASQSYSLATASNRTKAPDSRPDTVGRHHATAPTGRVRDITLRVDPRRRGLGAYSSTWGDNLVFDKNHDGIPDILLSNHLQRWAIWLGNGHGGFTFDRYLPATDRHNCAAADFGGPRGRPPDGRLDLYCVRGANKGTINDKFNALLIQRANGGFANVVKSWGAVDPSGRGRTVSILHIRGRGRPSLFVGNAEGYLYPSLDHIYVNVGRRFMERHTGGLPSEQNTRWCSDTGDFNHDGRQDFLTCSYSLRLYKNRTTPARRVTYRNVAQAEGIPSGRRLDGELIDLNRDGWPDLVTLEEDALTVRLNRRQTPHFSKVNFRFPLVAGRSFCVGRANGDTAPDLLVVQGRKWPTDRLQQRDWMLINRGFGRRFRPVPVPQPPRHNGQNGWGDTCTAIPHYRGARAAWTINNGYSDVYLGQHGYRQLVIYAP